MIDCNIFKMQVSVVIHILYERFEQEPMERRLSLN